ncbi:aldehyde dehydrogenase family protein [Niabella beijingensis]|uniref:aldehyde dehydrogenase family protein n=1 Tax=Niabella beijingensis TaxID=2872700 RepID=UPI001CBBE0CC|nr:aldehyde dehydrogenase family protein [Niabella beijingensis]MBZ4187965.1 aldehyde dehydrogenase family protein [Niabella beijingensis]
MNVINPATEEPIATLTEDDQQTLQDKWQRLKAAQPAWQARSLEARIAIVKQFSTLLEANKTTLSQVLTSEVGKPLAQSVNEINGAIGRINWLTANAVTYLKDEVMQQGPQMEERIVYEPLGVIANISAWNYPYLVGVNVFVPALLAGNAVLYKPSEYASLTGLEIERLWKEAGLEADLFLTAVGTGAVGALLLDLSFDGYFFTGSYRTGSAIYKKLAEKMVPCQCELGGKDPLYVTDAVTDIAAVAAATADGAFYNNGQSCCSVERIYVHEKNYEAYLAAFVKEVQSWKTGAPTESGVYFGPLTRKEQLTVLEAQIEDALQKGARLLTGGKRAAGKGYYFEPTVLTDVTAGMLVMKDESFGPLIGIMKVKDDEEAIVQMKDTEYGLTAAVYCTEQSRAERILQQVNAGTGYWNCCDRVSAALPWSGRQHSGFGATLSHAGLRAFTKPKAYHLKRE